MWTRSRSLTFCLFVLLILAVAVSGCKRKPRTWQDSSVPDDIPLPPASDSVQVNDLDPNVFDLPPIDPAELPPLQTIQESGIQLSEPPRQPTRPASGLDMVFFAFDSDDLDPDARAQLDRNAQWLRDNQTFQVQIEGHCDSRGTREYNYSLGQRRANSVREYLSSQGVHPNRMIPISYGEERPLAPGASSEADHARNRRAQFRVY